MAAGGGPVIRLQAPPDGSQRLIVAAASLAFSWYQWRGSGPALKVTINLGGSSPARDRLPIGGATIVNSGRMPAIVGSCWLVPTRPTVVHATRGAGALPLAQGPWSSNAAAAVMMTARQIRTGALLAAHALMAVPSNMYPNDLGPFA
jgi:hypothetical protein